MGFTTVAIISNDWIDRAAADDSFGEKVLNAVRNWYSKDRFALRAGPLEVVSQSHADYSQVVIARHNCAWSSMSGAAPSDADLYALRDILEQHGFKVTKKRARQEHPANAG